MCCTPNTSSTRCRSRARERGKIDCGPLINFVKTRMCTGAHDANLSDFHGRTNRQATISIDVRLIKALGDAHLMLQRGRFGAECGEPACRRLAKPRRRRPSACAATASGKSADSGSSGFRSVSRIEGLIERAYLSRGDKENVK